MKIHDVEQGSVDWSLLRSGIPTASEFDNLFTPEMKPRAGQMPQSYLAKKLSEKWQGGPLASLNVFDMEQGKILEEEARPFAALELGEEIQQVGFITTDDGRSGCSPDGLIGTDGGIEIKCPRIETHISYLLNGELPKDYAAQVHGSIYVTGRDWWRFLSYRRESSPLLILIERDAEIMERIATTLADFHSRFDEAWAMLCELNGGPPVSYALQKAHAQFVSDPNDLIP